MMFLHLLNKYIYYLIVLCIFLNEENCVKAWTTEELELFDLVEEINQNFYEVLGLDQSATVTEVRKAYRRLSLQFHPDKNKEEGAEEKFRNIVSVSEVLRDDERRKHYDLILKNGLPDWRMPIFYYRRVRKMGLLELFVFMSFLLTLGHFLLSWAAYWERKYELEEVLSARFKKKKVKKSKVQEDDTEEIIASQVSLIPKPSLHDLLPALIVKGLVNFVLDLPNKIQTWREQRNQQLQSDDEDSEEEGVEERVRKPRKKVKAELPDFYNLVQTNTLDSTKECNGDISEQYSEVDSNKDRDWSEQDVIHLVKAMNKFPGGTSQRWEKIASTLKRTVAEVTIKVKSLKSSSVTAQVSTSLQGLTGKEKCSLNIEADQSYDENYNSQIEIQQGLRSRKPNSTTLEEQKEVASSDDGGWGQPQQKGLEAALQQFPKGTDGRWDKIAEAVPGKTKEECLLRYKVLVELIRKRKSQTVI